jgi:hypothetical protein
MAVSAGNWLRAGPHDQLLTAAASHACMQHDPRGPRSTGAHCRHHPRDTGPAAGLAVPPGRDRLIAFGPLLSGNGATWLGTAVLIRAPDPDTAGAGLTPGRHAGIEVHNWQFGGRPSGAGWLSPSVTAPGRPPGNRRALHVHKIPAREPAWPSPSRPVVATRAGRRAPHRRYGRRQGFADITLIRAYLAADMCAVNVGWLRVDGAPEWTFCCARVLGPGERDVILLAHGAPGRQS